MKDETNQETSRSDDARRLADVEALAGIGSWEWNVVDDSVHWSEQQFRIFGVEPDAFEPTHAGYLARLHPDDRPFAEANIDRALSAGVGFEADYRLMCADDGQRWVHCRGTVVSDDGVVRRLIGTSQDITDQRRREVALAHRAMHDPLTELPNRALLRDRLEHALLRGDRTSMHTIVFFVDIDGLKMLNDRAGHEYGDQALVTASRRLSLATRQNDTVARYGGDEFVIVAEDVRLPVDAVQLGARILDACTFVVAHPTIELEVSASVGGAVAHEGTAPEHAIRDADVAMYTAKSRGGRTVELVGVS